MGERIESRDSPASSSKRQPGLTSLEKDTGCSSTPQSSVVSSVVVVEQGNDDKSSEEVLMGTSKARYLERVRILQTRLIFLEKRPWRRWT